MPDTILTDSARKTNNSFPANPNFAPPNGGNLLNGPCNSQEFARFGQPLAFTYTCGGWNVGLLINFCVPLLRVGSRGMSLD